VGGWAGGNDVVVVQQGKKKTATQKVLQSNMERVSVEASERTEKEKGEKRRSGRAIDETLSD